MTILAQAVAPDNQFLDESTIREVLEQGLAGRYPNARLLFLIPDHTRTIPLPMLFRTITKILHDVRQLDFMVALGTHPPLSDEALNKLVGITAEERTSTYQHIGLLNHDWENGEALTTLGILTVDEIKEIAGDLWHPSLGGDTAIRINKKVLDYDEIIILGPTFPHEVVGFSGGAKYLFPGISGAEMIHVTHWLGALMTILDTIGIQDTPMRDMIHRAVEKVPTPISLISMVVMHDGQLAGIFVGDHLTAWRKAADLSAQRHIIWIDKPFQKVLSWADAKYDELWTGAKAMYKLEPAIAEGGELILYAPHMMEVSIVHSDNLYQAGYHIRDYYLANWEHYKQYPLGVLAHGTHLKGSGIMENGIEKPRIQVTLSSPIPEPDCAQLNLGYLDPSTVNPDEWQNRENEGVLFVPHAGEILYRAKP